jgi:hypothetical protein
MPTLNRNIATSAPSVSTSEATLMLAGTGMSSLSFELYDALYLWCRELKGEAHRWPPKMTGAAKGPRPAVLIFLTHLSLEHAHDAGETRGRGSRLRRATLGEAPMRTVLSAGVLALPLVLALGASSAFAQATNLIGDGEVHVNFEDWPVGGPPPSPFETGLTGKGRPVRWALLEDPDAPDGPTVLAETSGDTTSDRFPLAILKDFEARDVEVRVRFKPIAGEVDQAAGLMVRVRDADNYYIARANALEGNVRLYKVVDGERRQFAGADVEVPRGTWQELGLTVEGDRFAVALDGKELFRATDQTFAGTGRVGLWTKADSVTHFDGLIVRRLP